MAKVSIRVLGCGDAFGSGGRLQTSFCVTAGDERFMIDCGATALVGMRRFGVDPDAIDTVLLSHLHGDHYGGLPFFLLHAHHAAKRTRPLVIAGPAGVEQRLMALLDAMFEGAAEVAWGFPLQFVELTPRARAAIQSLTVEAFPVDHSAAGTSLGLRIEVHGRTIAFSGDTQWTPSLIPLAHAADLFICECYAFDHAVSHHLNYRELSRHADALTAKRILLTHMSEDMLARRGEVELEMAADGQLIEL